MSFWLSVVVLTQLMIGRGKEIKKKKKKTVLIRKEIKRKSRWSLEKVDNNQLYVIYQLLITTGFHIFKITDQIKLDHNLTFHTCCVDWYGKTNFSSKSLINITEVEISIRLY